MMEKGAVLWRAVREERFEGVTLNPRPDGHGGISHAGIWRKKVPSQRRKPGEGPEVGLTVQGY